MKTLITGANGHVGANLVRQLISEGRDVRALTHQREEALAGLNVECVRGDILDPQYLETVFENVDIVHHLAARIDVSGDNPVEMFQINIEGTRNIVNACLNAKVKRLIHYSSIHALSYLPKTDPIDETRALALDERHLGYDRSKAQAELEVQKGLQKGLEAVVLNPVGIIGPYDFQPSPMGELLLQLAHRELPGMVNAGFHWVDVRDVVAAAIAAETRGQSGERYILHGDYARLPAIAKRVALHTGQRAPRLNTPMWVARLAAPMAKAWSQWKGVPSPYSKESLQILACHQTLQTRKAIEHLGFTARPINDTLRETLSWFAENDRLRPPAAFLG